MVVSTRELTRGLGSHRVELAALETIKNARVRDLALDNSAEPLNATAGRKTSLSLLRNLEGHSTLLGKTVIGRVPVVSANGKPLIPCWSSKARKLLARGLAEKRWNKLGQFYLQLKFDPQSECNKNQQVCLAVDAGSKWDGIAVVSKEGVLTSAMLILPSKIAEKLEVRRQMRRARRYRKTPMRAKRFDNRRKPEGWLAPSQKAKVDFRIKVVDELCKLYPFSRFAVEDVRFNHYKKRWGKHFSTVEIGKTKFYNHLRKLGSLRLYDGVETAGWREKLGLAKNSRKSSLTWDSHAVDAVAVGCAEVGYQNPFPSEFWVWRRFQYSRRQLHRLEPDKGGTRRRYGGSWSLYLFKKADVVKWHGGLARVGGYMNGLSLHRFDLRNRRFTQDAKPKDCIRLFNQQIFAKYERPQLTSHINGACFLEVFL